MAESKSTLKNYAEPTKFSWQDGVAWKPSEKRLSLYKVRYSYSPRRTQSTSRDFCKKMVDIAKDEITYRWEDIYSMGRDGVNSELAAKGKNSYSIWLYKGGKYCHHYWRRRVFVRKYIGIKVPEWISKVIGGKDSFQKAISFGDVDVDPNVNSFAELLTGAILKEMPIPDMDKVNIFRSIKDPKKFVTHRLRQFMLLYLEHAGMPANLILKTMNNAFKSFDSLTKFLRQISKGNDRMIGIPNPKRSSSDKLENDTEIDVREARRRAIKYIPNRRRVATKPIDMKDGGAYRSGGETGHIARRVVHEAGLEVKRQLRRTVSQIENDLLEKSKQAIFGTF